MNIAKLSRLAPTFVLGALGLLLIAGCSESTSSSSTYSSSANTTTGTSTRQAAPMVAGNPAPRSHSDESVSFFSEGPSGNSSVTPPPPPSSTTTKATTVTRPAPMAAPVATPASKSLPPYQADYAVRGRLRSIGSDTMDKMMADWEKDFKNYHQGVRVFHEGKGSSTAIPALVEGRSDFGPMSRQVKSSEVEKFEQQFGYAPTSMPVAIDALAIYVHPDNPIKDRGLSMSELDAIFSSTRRRGYSSDIKTWGDLGLTGEWANKPINVYSRNSASGTYGFFKDEVLNKGDFKGTNRELPGSEEVVRSVENDPYGIGYSGFGYKTPGVALAPLTVSDGGAPVAANQDNAVSGAYPLARNLYLTINQRPGEEPKTLHAEFIRYVYSDNGQTRVSENGYFPVSSSTANQQLNSLGLSK
ncbi:MAG: PstS family phosphate ABC transporter substrate-binding protein [Puniceicoccales bacterium]